MKNTETEIQSPVETETQTQAPVSPQRPNPFRRENDDTQVIPDLEPQG